MNSEMKDCYLYGGNFPPHTEYRETAVFSCTSDVRKCYVTTMERYCYVFVLLSYPGSQCSSLLKRSCLAERNLWSNQAQLTFSFVVFFKSIIQARELRCTNYYCYRTLMQKESELYTLHWSISHKQTIIRPYLRGQWDCRLDNTAWLALFVMFIIIQSYCQHKINSCNRVYHDKFCGRLLCFLSQSLNTLRGNFHSSLW